jgi:hypothetical protein
VAGLLKTLVNFSSSNVTGPGSQDQLILDANGDLFGTTGGGISNGTYGTVFEIVNTTTVLSNIPVTSRYDLRY